MTIDTLVWTSVWAVLPIFLAGSLLHFLYDWSGENRIVARIAAVNESYWEHIKIAVWPLFFFYALTFVAGGHRIVGFVPAATIALYSVPVTMITIVFGYKRVIGRNILWLDILVFLATIVVSLLVFVLLTAELAASGVTIGISAAFLAVLLFAFAVYSVAPPAEPDFFRDPLSSKYGLDAHGHESR